MKMTIVAGLVVVALLGVGIVAASAAMAPGGMGTPAGGMGSGMSGGMMGGDMQGMHDQMHDQCPCCQGDNPNA